MTMNDDMRKQMHAELREASRVFDAEWARIERELADLEEQYRAALQAKNAAYNRWPFSLDATEAAAEVLAFETSLKMQLEAGEITLEQLREIAHTPYRSTLTDEEQVREARRQHAAMNLLKPIP